ncbi:MAG: glycoside hydrolase 43 family protein [Acidobacteriota bacterium]|nr:glycoside hydrolase 43 family protein [Acidobacteriota bacterium]
MARCVFGQIEEFARTWGDWQTWGDQGDGTFLNPILPSDYSDLDAIRVGSDYYAISSTFQFSPGIVILHSKDLVNWTILSHAASDLTQISPELNWDKMNRYGRGIWAGAIRFHDGKFWIYFGTPDEGYFMTTAKNPAGKWQPLHRVLAEKGWDDCAPFWDDDGQGYLVGTNFSDGYKIYLFKLTPDGRDIMRESGKVIHQSKGSEANKLYKFNGFYYHFFSEVKSEGRVVMMERAKNIWGPYDEIKQLNHAEKEFREPNQGGILQTTGGGWYFLTHHGGGDWSGRVMSLLPVTWIGGFPIIGNVGADGIGQMVWSGKMPVRSTKKVTPQTDDEFSKTEIAPQWEFNYQPRAEKWSLTERRGFLRLRAFKTLDSDNILKAGNTLTQRVMRTTFNEVVIKLDLRGLADGEKAGLCHFASPNYSSFGVAQHGAVRQLEFNLKGDLTAGNVVKGNDMWIKSTWGLDGKSQYFYSLDGKTYQNFGEPYQMMWGSYRGDRIGIFNYNNRADEGFVDVDFFHYDFSKSR